MQPLSAKLIINLWLRVTAVLGEPLEICSIQPMTGFYRDGSRGPACHPSGSFGLLFPHHLKRFAVDLAYPRTGVPSWNAGFARAEMSDDAVSKRT
jgi:hypothetical protein